MIFEEQCRDAISLVPVYFAIVSGQVRTQSDDPLHSILDHVFHQVSAVDDTGRLDAIATPEAASALIKAIYDEDALPLVEASAADLPLDPQHKARLLVEGIAGAIAVATRLANSDRGPITPERFQRTLDEFSVSPHRQRIREAVEHSHLFSECLMPSQILDLIMNLAHDEEASRPRPGLSYDDYTRDMFCSEHERSVAHSMGLPWGMTGFMVLN